jgi:hypothetical protein
MLLSEPARHWSRSIANRCSQSEASPSRRRIPIALRLAERNGVELRGFFLSIPMAANPLAACAQRGRVLVASLIVLLCLVSLGFMDDPGVIAQENGWRMAMDPTVRTAEQEKALAGRPGSDFKECANGFIPAAKFIMGSPENEPDRDKQRRSATRGNDRKNIRHFQVRGDIRRLGRLRRRGCVPASSRQLGCSLALAVNRQGVPASDRGRMGARRTGWRQHPLFLGR